MNVIPLQLTAFLAATSVQLCHARHGVSLVGTGNQMIGHTPLLFAAQLGMRRQAPLLTPLPNDTIPSSYWEEIDAAIAKAETQLSEAKPSTATAAPVQPWEQVYTSSNYSSSWTADAMTPGEVSASKAYLPTSASASTLPSAGQISMVPYDMQLGGRLMSGITERAPSEKPSQALIDQTLVALCPMIFFSDTIDISAPKCDQTMGSWTDPTTQRSLLRWTPSSGGGGMRFGVDSAVHGNGSITYAEISEKMGWKGTSFSIFNCLGLMRWTVEEEIMRVANMGVGTSSTLQEHDVSLAGEAYFYKYTIKSSNGTAVASTNLFRSGTSQVNVTLGEYDYEQIGAGSLVAVAQKKGYWKSQDWESCSTSATNRVWNVNFPLQTSTLSSVATVQDIRIATAALVTLMAFREEHTSEETGLNLSGQLGMAYQLLEAGGIIALVLGAGIALFALIKYKHWDERMRRLLFKVEAVLLPKRPSWQREPVFQTTY